MVCLLTSQFALHTIDTQVRGAPKARDGNTDNRLFKQREKTNLLGR